MTTDAQRCNALTINSFSLRTAIGSEMSAMSACSAGGSATYAAVSSCSTSCASGSSATAAGSGPASTSRTSSCRRRCGLPAAADPARSFRRMKPSSSGLNPFSRSHLEIWVTMGRKSNPTPPLSCPGPKLPSGASRVAIWAYLAGTTGCCSATSPALHRMPTSRGTSRSRFLCPSGSMAGRMMPARPARKSGMYSGAVNTAWS